MPEPYGAKELAFAAPFAEELAANPDFRVWLLRIVGLDALALGSRLLDEEMKAQRSKTAGTWWRSHFNGRCRCDGCRGGQETDLLAVFALKDASRMALHVEVKQPSDRFPSHKDQAANYALRAACWTQSCPPMVIGHSRAETMLLCSAAKLSEYRDHLPKFGSVVTFEQVIAAFPNIAFPR